jgi:hypothetical protein
MQAKMSPTLHCQKQPCCGWQKNLHHQMHTLLEAEQLHLMLHWHQLLLG